MTLTPGTTLGPYEILSLLGEGGMGSVYKARDPRLGRFVAIKVAREQFNERFDREARAVAALNHNNICTLYDIGPNYLVMEYIEGPTLAMRIRQGALTLDDAMPILKQLVDGIEAAHEKNIYHRDLKPENIKITPEGVVKILDFGLAKAADPLSDLMDPANAPTIRLASVAGMIMGTPAYMSPEQAAGQPVDKRADIWAFGVLLWEMLTGRRLFEGQTIAHTLADVINKEFQLDDAPAKVHPLLRRCLVRDVRRRMRDIGEARIALEKIAAGEDDVVAAPLPSPAAQRRWLLPAFAAALITAAALGVYIFLPKKPVEQPLVWLKADVEPDPSYRGGIAISRDGSKYVYASSGEQRKLYVRRLDREAAVPISGTDRATHPFLSPDGQWVAFAAEGKLKKVSIDGGVAIPLANIGDEGFRGGSWGEDGHLVAALSANGSLMKISENGGNPTELTKLGKEERAHRFPHHLPDGKGVLFMTAGDGTDYDRSVIEAVSFRDGKRSVLHRGGYHPRYLASGHFAYIFEGALFAAPLNLDRLEAAGPPVPLLSSVRYVSAGSAFLDIARNGTLVYGKGPSRVSTAGLEVRWLLEGQTKTEPLVAAPDLSFFRLSADGSRVAYDKRLSAAEGIWIYDVRRETNTKITFETGGHNPVFSADGKQIVFAAKGGLYWTRADGASKPERILEGVGFVPTSLSPDGRHLLYHHTTPGRQGRSCFLLPLEPSGGAGVPRAGKPQPILEEGASHAVFSPDGKWIAYQNIENRAHVFVRPYPDRGAKWQISAQESGLKPVWSPAGRRLFYLSGSGHAWVVDYAVKGDSFEAGKPRIWSDVQVPPVAAASIQASPDGKRLAANMGRSSNEDAGATKTYVILNFLDEVRRKIKSK